MFTLSAKIVLGSLVFTTTFLFPFLFILAMLFWGKGLLSSLQMETRKERSYPFITTSLLYYLSYYFLKSQGAPVINIEALFIWGATMLIIVSLIINFWWKISVHMIGIGGLTGALFLLNFKSFFNFPILILILIFFAGLTGYARLKLEAHKPSQVYIGFLTGISVMFFIFYFVIGRF